MAKGASGPSNERSDSLYLMFMALSIGVLIGGVGVYALTPPALQLDPSILSTYVTEQNQSHCPEPRCPEPRRFETKPKCPHCTCPIQRPSCPSCTHTVAGDELLTRGKLEQNPKNAPIVSEYMAPRIIPLDGFVTPEECAQLIQTVTESEKFEAGRISNPTAQNRSANRKVSMTVLDIDKYRWIYERLMTTVTFYNDRYWQYRLPTNVNSTLLEPVQFYKYDGSEQGHYNWHSDVGVRGATAKRSLSVSVQLSAGDSYEGGDFMIQTSVDSVGLMRTQGTMFLFPSFVLHKVTPVTRGTRYSLVAWIETA